MKGKKNSTEEQKNYKPLTEFDRAETANGRESQLAMLAMEEMENRIRNHEASGMELVYLAKLGSENTRMEQEKHDAEIQLMRAKIRALEAGQERDELYAETLAAFKSYAVKED